MLDRRSFVGTLLAAPLEESHFPDCLHQFVARYMSVSEWSQPIERGGVRIPTQHGPANLLRARPTGVPASMILFPQDDLKRWCGPYPPAAVRDQFRKLTAKWDAALDLYRKAASGEDLAIAEACGLHFRSTANQVEFYLLRDSGGDRERMRGLILAEIDCARKLLEIARRQSVIGYEASNHYYYRPLALAEKVLNCRYLLEHDFSR